LIEQILAIKHDAEELSGIVSPRAGGDGKESVHPFECDDTF
jgi:hypothetical protein